LINEVNRALNNASVSPVDGSVAQTSSMFGKPGNRLFGNQAMVAAGVVPASPAPAPSPAVIQAAQTVAAQLPATTGAGSSAYTGGGGGGGGGGGDLPPDATATAMTDAPPVGWWAGLSTMMKGAVVAGGLGAAYFGYKTFARGGHSAGHKS
jgi:hypothetical protein